MSFSEIKAALPSLSPEQRVELQESLDALHEGVSVEELRAINAALDEELNDPSPELTEEQVRADLRALTLDDAA